MKRKRDFGNFGEDITARSSSPLSWRQPADVSFSDWTIVVQDGDKKETYHVHKIALGTGERACQYFTNMFRNSKEFVESSDCRSVLELQSSAAKAFPQFLDFIYTGEGLNPCSVTAVPLLYLADYLRNRLVFEAVSEFMQSDLEASNALLYMTEADAYSLTKVVTAAQEVAKLSRRITK